MERPKSAFHSNIYFNESQTEPPTFAGGTLADGDELVDFHPE